MDQLLLASLLESGAIGAWTWDASRMQMLQADATLLRLFGISGDVPSDDCSSRVWQAVAPRDRFALLRWLRRLLKQGEHGKFECRVWHADGSVHWIEARAHAAAAGPSTAAAYPLLSGLVLDITDSKLSEERLRRQTRVLQELGSASLAIGAAVTTDAVLSTGARWAAQIVGVRRVCAAVIVNDRWDEQRCQSFSAPDRMELAQLPQSGPFLAVCRRNITLRHDQSEWQGQGPRGANGETACWQGFLGTPLLDRDGKNVGLLAVTDSTGGAFTSEDEAILVQIARIVAVAIENARLYLELREADRRKDEFLAVLSHELRAPLNVISGHTELLKGEAPGSSEFLQSLDAIDRNTKAQTQLIADLLDVSRIITGKLILDIAPFEVLPVIRSAIDAVRFAAQSRRIRLVEELAPDLGTIVGEATRLQQVLWNLLSNAVKFTGEGGEVRLMARRNAGALEFRVQDTGLGISPDFLPYVFDRFQQEDTSKTRRYGGLGLGLAIVRHITELHGGWVWVESEGKDKGATFTVTIPLRSLVDAEHEQDASAKAEPQRVKRAVPESQEQILSGIAALVTDDQIDARNLVAKILTRAGAAVASAASADEALHLLKAQPFDLIICDVGMPEINGYDFIRQWRDHEQAAGLPHIPAAALTAYASERDRNAALAAGYQCHLAKPVRIRDIVEQAARLVGRTS